MRIRKAAVKENATETVKEIDNEIRFLKLKLQPIELPEEWVKKGELMGETDKQYDCGFFLYCVRSFRKSFPSFKRILVLEDIKFPTLYPLFLSKNMLGEENLASQISASERAAFSSNSSHISLIALALFSSGTHGLDMPSVHSTEIPSVL